MEIKNKYFDNMNKHNIENIFEKESYNKFCYGLFGFLKDKDFKVTRSYKSIDRIEILKFISNLNINKNLDKLLSLFDNINLKKRNEVERNWCSANKGNFITPKIDYNGCIKCNFCQKLTSFFENDKNIDIFDDSRLLGHVDWTYIIDISNKQNISLCINSSNDYNDFLEIPIVNITHDKIKSLFNVDDRGLLFADMNIINISKHFNKTNVYNSRVLF